MTETMAAAPTLHVWVVLALVCAALVGYARDGIPEELTSLGVLAALLLWFHLVPLLGPDGEPVMQAEDLLRGFSSPALIAVIALLVIGQAVVQTGAVRDFADRLLTMGGGRSHATVGMSLGAILGLSAFMNNTPVVIIFIPILRAVAERLRRSVSQVMIPVSYAAILGGMLTLIGSSTNLLVSQELALIGERPLHFFDPTVPGLVLAGAGFAYLLLIVPLLPRREPVEANVVQAEGKQFIAELDVDADSPFRGATSQAGLFPALPDITVRLIQRGDRVILPPFEDVQLQAGDVLIVAATRRVLAEMLTRMPGHLLTFSSGSGGAGSTAAEGRPKPEATLAEVMVVPASRLVGQTLELTNFAQRSRCIVLGIQRRARMLRSRMNRIRLEAGDVLLIFGQDDDIRRLRNDPDVLLMEWTAGTVRNRENARRTLLWFLAAVLPAALGLVPITISAIIGVIGLLATGCLNLRQAARAVDRRIVLIIGAALALGTAMEKTGAAAFVAMSLLDIFEGASVTTILAVFFGVVALMTNLLSNNACGVLFTPVAVNLATKLGVDPLPFAMAVLFGANCSFVTPIGYQTNLLVMGPGQYRFGDFVRAGLPLVGVVWLAFILFAPWYYGL